VPTPKPIEEKPAPVVLAAAPVATPAPAPKPAAKPKPKSFAELMRGIDVPAAERARNSDAVDITAITPAKPKPKVKPTPKAKPKPKEPPKPAHPSRHWVQVAGGADTTALKAEWRRMTRKAPDAFKGMKGWTTPLNKTNRVLTGPFDSKKAAQAFVNKLAKEDVSAFTFTSDKGQVINKLD
jgi:cell division protein FtsN